VVTGQEDLVEVPPHEVNGSTITVAEVSRGRGFGDRAEDEHTAERYEDPTPRPGPNAEKKPRPGRGRGRGRGCYVCGDIGCHSRNHPDGHSS